MRRIFLCPGPSQLITAIAACDCQAASLGRDWRQDDNYLVIDTLATPGEESGRFAGLIEQLANQVTSWRGISYLSPQIIEQLAGAHQRSGEVAAAKKLRDVVGVDSADTIWLCRNWMFTNELLLNTYRAAEKICYGDGFGLYSPRPQTLAGSNIASRPSRFRALKQARRALRRFGEKYQLCRPKHRTLPTIEFDTGYFALAENPQGLRPPMAAQLVAAQWPRNMLEQLTSSIPATLVSELQTAAQDRPCVFLLGENLTEAGEMTEGTEISAWCKLLKLHQVDSRATLVYKPHPRDSLDKVGRFADALRKVHSTVLVLHDERIARLPFELLFLAAFPDTESRRPVTVITTGSSVISLKFYLNFDAKFGWGPLLSHETGFSAEFVAGNRGFEKFVREQGAMFAPRALNGVRTAA